MQDRSTKERALAPAKIADLEQEQHRVKDRLIPEQKAYWEEQIAKLKTKYGVK